MSIGSVDLHRAGRGSATIIWAAGSVVAALVVGFAAGHRPLLGVAVLIVLVVSYAVVIEPLVGVVALAAATPVTAGIKRGLVVPHLRPNEALIVWLVPLILLSARRPVRRWGILEWLGLAYAGGTLVLGAFDIWHRGSALDSASIDGLVGPFEYLALLRAVRVGVRTQDHVNIVVRTLVLAALPIAVFALAQGSGLVWAQHVRNTLTGTAPGHLNRATAVFDNWQVLAGYLLAVGLVGASTAAFRARRILPPDAALIATVVIAAGLARTLTIGALAGFAVGVVALLARQSRANARWIKWLAGGALLLLVAVLAARYHQEFVPRPGQASNGIVPNTIADRIQVWTRQYLPALSGRWITGYGPLLPPTVTWQYTDSVYVTLILRGGLVLLALYAALMAGFVAVARQTVNARAPEPRAVANALLVLVLVLVPLQTIATYFTTSGLPEVTWILAALVSTSVVPRSWDER
jgi:hypothetical protein